MRFLIRTAALLCLSLVPIATASAANLTVKFTSGQTVFTRTPVVAYLSFGTLQGITDAKGEVTFDVPRGSAMWFEVNGQRLRRFYREGDVPRVIDTFAVGFMTWNGGKKP